MWYILRHIFVNLVAQVGYQWSSLFLVWWSAMVGGTATIILVQGDTATTRRRAHYQQLP